jgi:hypothetical protein
MRYLEEKNPKRRGTKSAWGSRGGVTFHRSIQFSRRARSGRAALGSVVGRFCRPNAAFPAAEGPQVSKAARSRRGARKVHRSPAVRAWRPDDGVVADRPLCFLEHQHDTSSRCISNDRLKFKRTFETRPCRKQGIFVISPAGSAARPTARLVLRPTAASRPTA